MTPRTLRYRVQRPAHGRRRALVKEFATLTALHAWAFHTLNESAEVVEVELLPLGCECVARVGVVEVSGKVTWRVERRRAPTKRYRSDELARS